MYIIQDLMPIILGLGIMVVLPLGIVWLISKTKINAENRHTDVLIEAIKNNADIDARKLLSGIEKKKIEKSSVLQKYLLRGTIYTLLGIFFVIVTAIFANQRPYEKYQYSTLIISAVTLAVGIGYIVTFFFTKKSQSEQSYADSNKTDTEE